MCVHVEGGRQISWRMPFNWLGGGGVHQDVPAGIVLLVLSYIYIYIYIHDPFHMSWARLPFYSPRVPHFVSVSGTSLFAVQCS